MRSIEGVSHVSLTVPDMQRARWFWTAVMGFEVGIETPGATVCIHRGSGTVVGFRDHAGTVTGSFDETQVGMDHIAPAVSTVADLGEWTAWLDHRRRVVRAQGRGGGRAGPRVSGGTAQVVRQKGCPAGSAKTRKVWPPPSSRVAPSASARCSPVSRSSTRMSRCACCGREGSGHCGGL